MLIPISAGMKLAYAVGSSGPSPVFSLCVTSLRRLIAGVTALVYGYIYISSGVELRSVFSCLIFFIEYFAALVRDGKMRACLKRSVATFFRFFNMACCDLLKAFFLVCDPPRLWFGYVVVSPLSTSSSSLINGPAW